ncbi:Hypothetical protein CKL_2067 [Clostridium kluyveri DSM 555]|uniref:ABC transmembrane type-1 domain-containing protein n=3 Tax=Clostridium kluyveri TaxID=1534 RepID=A5MYY3_CLOK5|nr:Hypothetical protein CKL_2067 [Clostridium kluyveri DSM 555]
MVSSGKIKEICSVGGYFVEKLEFMISKMPIILNALPITLEILFFSVVIALVVGMILTYAKVGKNKVVRCIASIYISFMRGTPMIVQLLLAFIGIPLILDSFGISTANWNNIIYAIIAFSLNEAAFFAEIFRSAYLDIDKGQIEAGQSIGMTKFQTFRRIIFVQVAAKALPNTTNMIIELMKNTSLGIAIGVTDLMGMAKQISYNNYGVGQTETFIVAAFIYWIMGLILTIVSSNITARLNRYNNPVLANRKAS